LSDRNIGGRSRSDIFPTGIEACGKESSKAYKNVGECKKPAVRGASDAVNLNVSAFSI